MNKKQQNGIYLYHWYHLSVFFFLFFFFFFFFTSITIDARFPLSLLPVLSHFFRTFPTTYLYDFSSFSSSLLLVPLTILKRRLALILFLFFPYPYNFPPSSLPHQRLHLLIQLHPRLIKQRPRNNPPCHVQLILFRQGTVTQIDGLGLSFAVVRAPGFAPQPFLREGVDGNHVFCGEEGREGEKELDC